MMKLEQSLGHRTLRSHVHRRTPPPASSFPPSDFLVSFKKSHPTWPSMTVGEAWKFSLQGYGKYKDSIFRTSDLARWYVQNILDQPGWRLDYQTWKPDPHSYGDWAEQPGWAIMRSRILDEWSIMRPSHKQTLNDIIRKHRDQRTHLEKAVLTLLLDEVLPWGDLVAKRAVSYSSKAIQIRASEFRPEEGMTIRKFQRSIVDLREKPVIRLHAELMSEGLSQLVALARQTVTLPRV